MERYALVDFVIPVVISCFNTYNIIISWPLPIKAFQDQWNFSDQWNGGTEQPSSKSNIASLGLGVKLSEHFVERSDRNLERTDRNLERTDHGTKWPDTLTSAVWGVEPGANRIKFNQWSGRVLNPGCQDLKTSTASMVILESQYPIFPKTFQCILKGIHCGEEKNGFMRSVTCLVSYLPRCSCDIPVIREFLLFLSSAEARRRASFTD